MNNENVDASRDGKLSDGVSQKGALAQITPRESNKRALVAGRGKHQAVQALRKLVSTR